MKLHEEHVTYIKNAFKNMKSKEDLLSLLNYTKHLLHNQKTIPFELKHINYHCNPQNNYNRYTSFKIKKKSGEERIIFSPNPGLKKIQQCLNVIFQVVNDISPSAYGFVLDKSIVDNAAIHSGKNYVYNIDLKDFFFSIDQARIWGRFKYHPYNLNETHKRVELANIIASLCCQSITVERLNNESNWIKLEKNVLPQGAPTSPIISNIVCGQLDFYLSSVAKRFGLNYSRYADDITFSSMHNVYQDNSKFINEIHRIIAKQNFHINHKKTRLQKNKYRQEVTGLIVNEKPNISKRYIKQLRMWLYYWEHYGLEKTSNMFVSKYAEEKSTYNKEVPNMINVLGGKFDFLKMVKGDQNKTYLDLRNRYNQLITIDNTQKEEILASEEVPTTNTPPIKEYFEIPIYHNPQKLVDILKQFSKNNTALKYATHSWDGGKDEEVFNNFENFLNKIKSEFKEMKDLKDLNKQLWSKILSFLLNKKVGNSGWGIHRIKFGWSSPELLQEMRLNPNQKPENLVIPLKAQFHLKTNKGIQLIQKFQQVIDIFKNEIEIRDENSALLELILEMHDNYLEGFEIKQISNLENKNFYTDVDYLRKALSLIFENIQKRRKFNTVSYILNEDSNTYTLEILHIGSFVKGRSIKDQKLSLKYGDMSTIKDRLKNLCDWSIESEFIEGPCRINYLVSDEDSEPYTKIKEAQGFKYIFTFYK